MGNGAASYAEKLELVRRAQAGSSGALEELVKAYAPLIGSVAWRSRLGLRKGDACATEEDLRQQVAMQFIELVREYQPESEVPFGAYIKHKLRWRVHNFLRAERRRLLATTDLEDPAVEALIDVTTRDSALDLRNPRLRSAIRRLSPRQRLVIEKQFWEDKKLKDIARELNVKPQAVGGLRKRALETLRSEMCGPTDEA